MGDKIKGWENRPQETKDAEMELEKTVLEVNEELKKLHELMYGKKKT